MADVIGYTIGLLFAVNVTGVLFCVGVELFSRYNPGCIVYNVDGSIDHRSTDKFNEL